MKCSARLYGSTWEPERLRLSSQPDYGRRCQLPPGHQSPHVAVEVAAARGEVRLHALESGVHLHTDYQSSGLILDERSQRDTIRLLEDHLTDARPAPVADPQRPDSMFSIVIRSVAGEIPADTFHHWLCATCERCGWTMTREWIGGMMLADQLLAHRVECVG